MSSRIKARTRQTVILTVIWLIFLSAKVINAQDTISFTQETDQLILELIEAANALDAYNERCRGYGSSMKTDDVSSLLYEKYRARANDFLQAYKDKNVIAAQDEMNRNFHKNLREAGGCANAKSNGFEKGLQDKYRELLNTLEEST
jgi:hypothetical protein